MSRHRPAGALLTVMSGGALTPAQEYANTVLGLSPIAYWKMDEASGTTAADATGNNRTGTISDLTLDQTGQRGQCFQFKGVTGSKVVASAALTAALDPAEYSVSFLVKVNVNAALQVRLVNTYTTSSNEYSALEVRTGTLLSAFLREQGVNQTIPNGITGIVTDEQWHLITFFNSEATGNCGIYFNRDFRPHARTVAGNTSGIVSGYPEIGHILDGWMQHVAFFNRMLTQDEVDALYESAFGAEAAWSPSYDFRDDFTTDDDAPITSPRTAEPGPGALVVTDTGNKLSVTGAKLVWTTRQANYDPRAIQSTAQAVSAGKAIMGIAKVGSIQLGWAAAADSATGPQGMSFAARDAVIFLYPGGLNPPLAVVQGTTYQIAVVKQRVGAVYLIKGGAYTSWTVIYNSTTDAAGYYNAMSVLTTNQASDLNTMRVCSLGGNWLREYGLASTKLMGKRAAGNTFTHTADCVIDFIMAALPSAGQTIDFRFRIQDDNNYWHMSIPSDGVAILNEVVAGTPTLRATANGPISVNVNNRILMYGSTIRLYNSADAQKFTYASATNFATETDGKIAGIGTGAVLSSVIVFPYTIGAEDAAYLDTALA